MEWAVSSAEEHYLDTVGVTGSIPVSPTIPFKPLARFLMVLSRRESPQSHRAAENIISLVTPDLGAWAPRSDPWRARDCLLRIGIGRQICRVSRVLLVTGGYSGYAIDLTCLFL